MPFNGIGVETLFWLIPPISPTDTPYIPKPTTGAILAVHHCSLDKYLVSYCLIFVFCVIYERVFTFRVSYFHLLKLLLERPQVQVSVVVRYVCTFIYSSVINDGASKSRVCTYLETTFGNSSSAFEASKCAILGWAHLRTGCHFFIWTAHTSEQTSWFQKDNHPNHPPAQTRDIPPFQLPTSAHWWEGKGVASV